MKNSILSRPSFKLILFFLCVAGGTDLGLAQQMAYASTFYPTPQPTFGDRVRAAGQSVGDYVRRKFYGEPAPGANPQQPVYQRPGSGTRTDHAQSYNLDAPAQVIASEPRGTGFPQQEDRKTTPKDAPSPVSESKSELEKSTEEVNPKAKIKPTLAPVSAPTASKKHVSEPEPVGKKRYTPAKPSSLTITKTKTVSQRKRAEEDPPATLSPSNVLPKPPEPPRFDAPPEPKTEAKLNTETNSLPGGIETSSSTGGIAPTIGGSDFNLSPKSPEEEKPAQKTASNLSPEPKSHVDTESKSSRTFMTGKKTNKPGRVISPYAPYNELDITGLPTGSLALDPTTQKVFEVP